MTFREIAIKYGVSITEISSAVKSAKLVYKGWATNPVSGRSVRTWDEDEVVEALTDALSVRIERHTECANLLKAERNRLLNKKG